MKRVLIFAHRWLGVGLCLLFLLWFPSGIVMMYWDFPSVTQADRLTHSPALDPSAIRLSPADAYARLGRSEPPAQVRLTTFDGRPVYRFRAGRGEAIVYADTGDEQRDVSTEMQQRIVSAWTGQPAGVARVDAVDEVDQWTLQAPLRGVKPLWKYSWPDGAQVYVSGATGEIVQATTTASRWGAYLGAIPHWFYFTPLRKHGPAWSRVVIWSSGIATVTAILGIIVGALMYSPSKRYRPAGTSSSIPYVGQKRWHMILGLIVGVAAVTWTFSGMLSMDPFPSLAARPVASAPGSAGRAITQALRGRAPLNAFGAKDPRAALAQLPGVAVKDLEFTAFAGEPVYIATIAPGDTRIVPLTDEPPRAAFDQQRIIDLIQKAAGPAVADIRTLDQYDRYYLDRRRERPLPVILAQLNDPDRSRLYIDPATGRVVGDYSAANWSARWLYHGLHSLDFPWLYNHRPLWDVVVISLLLGGTALCVTSLILAWRVLGRTLSRTAA